MVRSEGEKLQVECVQRAPEHAVAQAQMEEEAGKERKRKVTGWSTRMLQEVESKQEYEDMDEMTKWKSISQEGVDASWEELSNEMEEEVLEKYKS